MRKSFANIICYNKSLEECREIVEELDELPAADLNAMAKSYFRDYGFPPPKVYSAETGKVSYMTLAEAEFRMLIGHNLERKLIHTPKALVIANVTWNWENICEKTAEISNALSLTCLGVGQLGPKSVTGEEAFVLGLFKDGEEITRIAFGDALNKNGLEERAMDWTAYTTFVNTCPIELEQAFVKKSKMKIIKILSETIGVDCGIKVETIDELTDERISPVWSNNWGVLYDMDENGKFVDAPPEYLQRFRESIGFGANTKLSSALSNEAVKGLMATADKVFSGLAPSAMKQTIIGLGKVDQELVNIVLREINDGITETIYRQLIERYGMDVVLVATLWKYKELIQT